MEIAEVVKTASLADLAVYAHHMASQGCRNLYLFADEPGAIYWRFRKPAAISEYCWINPCGEVYSVTDYAQQ